MDLVLRAIADPRRRENMRLVWTTELPASDIASHIVDVTRSAISQHLSVLKNASLLTERPDGNRRLYRADAVEMKRLRRCLDDYWSSGLD